MRRRMCSLLHSSDHNQTMPLSSQLTYHIVKRNDIPCGLSHQVGVSLLQHHSPEHLLLGMRLPLVVCDDLAESDLQTSRGEHSCHMSALPAAQWAEAAAAAGAVKAIHARKGSAAVTLTQLAAWTNPAATTPTNTKGPAPPYIPRTWLSLLTLHQPYRQASSIVSKCLL